MQHMKKNTHKTISKFGLLHGEQRSFYFCCTWTSVLQTYSLRGESQIQREEGGLCSLMLLKVATRAAPPLEKQNINYIILKPSEQ